MITILSNNNYTHAILDYGANINLFRGSERREILSFPDGPIVNHVDVLSNLLVETHKIEMIQIGLKKDMVALSFSNSTYFVIYVWNLTNLEVKTKFLRHESPIVSFTYFDAYDKIASVSDAGVIYVWDQDNGYIWRQFKLNTKTFKIVAIESRTILAVITEKPALGYALDV